MVIAMELTAMLKAGACILVLDAVCAIVFAIAATYGGTGIIAHIVTEIAFTIAITTTAMWTMFQPMIYSMYPGFTWNGDPVKIW